MNANNKKTGRKILSLILIILMWVIFFFRKERGIGDGFTLFVAGGAFFKDFIEPMNKKYKQENIDKLKKEKKISNIIIYFTFIIVTLYAIYSFFLPYLKK